jgi:phage terminase Nu1 subunit (DNA packaging protein)
VSERLLSAAPPPERYIDARALAELMGVSTRTIARMVAEGMPSQTWGMRRTRRFRPSEAIGWAASRDREGNAPGQRQPRE